MRFNTEPANIRNQGGGNLFGIPLSKKNEWNNCKLLKLICLYSELAICGVMDGKRKENLEAKLQTIMHTIENRKDDTVDFRHMGIDHLYVDESHKFKNLTFNMCHDRVAGLGNPEGSQRALNRLFTIRTIEEQTGPDLGAIFLSGTTISNSLTELYLLFKYLRPQEMERENLKTFDAWAAVFAKKSIDYEFSVTNEIVQKERFRYFIKVPELAAFYSEITDFRTAADIGIAPRRKTRYYTTYCQHTIRQHLSTVWYSLPRLATENCCSVEN